MRKLTKNEWKKAKQIFESQFPEGLNSLFPCMRDEYRWSLSRPPVADSRTVAKDNTEYHGVANLANQYAASAQYQEASDYFLLAAALRSSSADTNDLHDTGHDNAIETQLNLSDYFSALNCWQKNSSSQPLPQLLQFNLRQSIVDKVIAEGEQALAKACTRSYRR